METDSRTPATSDVDPLASTTSAPIENVVLMIEPAPASRLACAEVCADLDVRLVACSLPNMSSLAASLRPLVITVEPQQRADRDHLADIAVGVGAQAFFLRDGEAGPDLVDRLKLSIQAGLRMRKA